MRASPLPRAPARDPDWEQAALGFPVLSNERGITLGLAARRLIPLFPTDRPLDIEWLFESSRLYIVQVRPYVTR